MDERQIKRLLFTMLAALAIILLAKYMLSSTIRHLNQAQDARKAVVSAPPPVVVSAAVPASAVMAAEPPSSLDAASGIPAQ